MAIYRGPGGSGDATTDAASQATVATAKAAEAATSASAASSSASAAATSASNASTSAGNAETSKNEAETAKIAAELAENNAETAQTAAEAAQSAAELAETNAETAQTAAETAQTAAELAETNAETAQTAAETAQTAAELAETNAETAETNAANSATAAATSANDAATSYDSFDDRYLGAKATPPTLDNDGDALLTGALYWNTVSNQLFVWDGSAWDAAAFSASGAVTSFNTRTGAVTLNASDVNTALGSDAVLDSDIGSSVQAYTSVLAGTTASYTTAEETKLAGIETAADVTDTTNVTAAGAVMDSELTSEASVKALDQGVATTDSPSFAGLTVDTNTLYVDSTNNRVGIGTTSPSELLEVYGADPFISILNTGETLGGIKFADAQAPSTQNALLAFDSAGNSLEFSINNTEHMRITSTGRVGIGTTSPSGMLHLSGALPRIYLTDTDTATVSTFSGENGWLTLSAATSRITFNIAGSEKMRIVGDNVGIGTTSPTELVTLSANSQHRLLIEATDTTMSNGADYGGIAWETNDAAQPGLTTWEIFQEAAGTTGESELVIDYKGAEAMRIDGSGNVGIGKSSPSAKLDVKTLDSTRLAMIAGTTIGARFTSSANGLYIEGTDTTGNASYQPLFIGGSIWGVRIAGSEKMRITSSGNVGIGTVSPVKRLTISGASNGNITTLTDAATITPDLDSSDMFTVTLGGNRTLANPSNIDAGQTGSIFIVQDGTGSRTLAWGSYWDFAGGTAPTLSTAAGAVDRVDFIVRTSTSIHAVFTANYS